LRKAEKAGAAAFLIFDAQEGPLIQTRRKRKGGRGEGREGGADGGEAVVSIPAVRENGEEGGREGGRKEEGGEGLY